MPFSKSAHLIGDLHNWVGWTTIVVAAGHAGAALFHHLMLHHDALWRMLPARYARRHEMRAPSP
jgi:cytochrome b561